MRTTEDRMEYTSEPVFTKDAVLHTATDTAHPTIRKLAEDFLYDQAEEDPKFRALLEEQGCFGGFPLNDHIPSEWLDALACDLDGALADRFAEWMRTLKEGRPPTMYVVEWEAPL